MPPTTRRTTTYDNAVLELAERVRSPGVYRRALVELAGHEPETESAVLNDLGRIAAGLVERRALEIGYRELAETHGDEGDDVDDFLASQALAGLDYEDDADPTALLDFLSRGSA
jgi:hypothetical protein